MKTQHTDQTRSFQTNNADALKSDKDSLWFVREERHTVGANAGITGGGYQCC